jgi:hypothetical protein
VKHITRRYYGWEIHFYTPYVGIIIKNNNNYTQTTVLGIHSDHVCRSKFRSILERYSMTEATNKYWPKLPDEEEEEDEVDEKN